MSNIIETILDKYPSLSNKTITSHLRKMLSRDPGYYTSSNAPMDIIKLYACLIFVSEDNEDDFLVLNAVQSEAKRKFTSYLTLDYLAVELKERKGKEVFAKLSSHIQSLVNECVNNNSLSLNSILVRFLFRFEVEAYHVYRRMTFDGSFMGSDKAKEVILKNESLINAMNNSKEIALLSKVMFNLYLKPSFFFDCMENPSVEMHELCYEEYLSGGFNNSVNFIPLCKRMFNCNSTRKADVNSDIDKKAEFLKETLERIVKLKDIYLLHSLRQVLCYIPNEVIESEVDRKEPLLKFDGNGISVKSKKLSGYMIEREKQRLIGIKKMSRYNESFSTSSFETCDTDSWYNNYTGVLYEKPIFATDYILVENGIVYKESFNKSKSGLKVDSPFHRYPLFSDAYIQGIVELYRSGNDLALLEEIPFLLERTKGVIELKTINECICNSLLIIDNSELEKINASSIPFILKYVLINCTGSSLFFFRDNEDEARRVILDKIEYLQGISDKKRDPYFPAIFFEESSYSEVIKFLRENPSASFKNTAMISDLNRNYGVSVEEYEKHQQTMLISKFFGGVISPAKREVSEFNPMKIACISRAIDIDSISLKTSSSLLPMEFERGCNKLTRDIWNKGRRLRKDETIVKMELLTAYSENFIEFYETDDDQIRCSTGSCTVSGDTAYVFYKFLWEDLVRDIKIHQKRTQSKVTKIVILRANLEYNTVEALELMLDSTDENDSRYSNNFTLEMLSCINHVYSDSMFTPHDPE